MAEVYNIGKLSFSFIDGKWFLNSSEGALRCNWLSHILNPYRNGQISNYDAQIQLSQFVSGVTMGANTYSDWLSRINDMANVG